MAGRFGYTKVIQTNMNGIQTRFNASDVYLPPVQFITSATVSSASDATYTAKNIIGGLVTRTDASADSTDTLPSAVSIIAAIHGASVGTSLKVIIQNSTLYNITIQQAANGVSFSPSTSVIIPSYRTIECMLVVESVTSGSEVVRCVFLL